MREFPYVKVDAPTPFERGIQYGEQAKVYILKARNYYKAYFEARGDSWETVCRFAADYADLIRSKFPDLVSEAEGIAQGAGLSFADIMVVNCRYEMSKFPKIPECTTGAVLNDATEKGCTYSFKNWDFSQGVLDHVIILHVVAEDGTRILGLTEAGQMIRDGFNNHGLSIGTNNLQSVHDSAGFGMPVTFLRRKILMCREFGDAEKLIEESARTVSNNILLTDGKNSAARDYEWHPEGENKLEPEQGILTHANHFVETPEIDAIKGRPKNRDIRLRELLKARYGHITPEYIMECMKDHEYYPLSICSHPSPDGDGYTKERITVSSMVVDFENECAYICAGPPCSGEYKKYHL